MRNEKQRLEVVFVRGELRFSVIFQSAPNESNPPSDARY
eukprot:COSAG02_NODE_28210_length_594_cov_0.618182_2_plen_38_part_01